MKKVASRLRLELAQFRELAAFAQFASDLDESTRQRIRRGELLTEILKQSDIEPVPFERQVVAIYAAINGYLDSIAVADVKAFETKFLDYLEKRYRDTILKPIAETGELAEAVETKLKQAIEECKQL